MDISKTQTKRMKYFTRYAVHEDGKVTEIKVPSTEAKKNIRRMLKRDKKMLDILKEL